MQKFVSFIFLLETEIPRKSDSVGYKRDELTGFGYRFRSSFGKFLLFFLGGGRGGFW